MNYSLRIHSSCIDELIGICNWYDDKRLGLGDEFESSFDVLASSILKNPLGYQVLKKNIRRARIEVFPYSAFYFIENQTIIIVGVMHHRRSPKQLSKIIKRNR